MRTGDIALVKKSRFQEEPFKLLNAEATALTEKVWAVHYPTLTGIVWAVHYPTFTVKYDKPLPDGSEYQEFHVNQISGTVTVRDGTPAMVLSVIADVVAEAKQTVDLSKPEQTIQYLAQALMRIEAICKEHLNE